jgi:hypothetical protein
MINHLSDVVGLRHDDFEQLSSQLSGEYVHHIRAPWMVNIGRVERR